MCPTPNDMPPRLAAVPETYRELLALADEADFLMSDFMGRGYDPDLAATLTEITLYRYDDKENF